MTLKKYLRSLYYKYFAKIQFHTVVLRGGLNADEKNYLHSHFALLKKYKKFFDNDTAEEKILEIGFGNGSHLKYLGETFNTKKYSIYGLELDWVSIFKMLHTIDKSGFLNLKIIREDARIFINNCRNNFFNNIFILYSDPWPRKRDFKKRLLNKKFIEQCLQKIKNDGRIILATDIFSYQEQIESILHELSNESVINFLSLDEEIIESINMTEMSDLRQILQTKFAKKAKKEGRKSKIFVLQKLT